MLTNETPTGQGPLQVGTASDRRLAVRKYNARLFLVIMMVGVLLGWMGCACMTSAALSLGLLGNGALLNLPPLVVAAVLLVWVNNLPVMQVPGREQNKQENK